jgi:tryptophan synthase alpha chain
MSANLENKLSQLNQGNRIHKAFAAKAKIAYLTAGDGGDLSSDYFLAVIKGGANIVEIGVPFSDPVADGSVIQAAMMRSLTNGTNLATVLNIIECIRSHSSDAAIIIFSYYNPIANNIAGFLNQAKINGADGILIVDLPYEESGEVIFLCNLWGLSLILVAAPGTPLPRMVEFANASPNGFLYYACNNGVTGLRNELPKGLTARINEIKSHITIPVAVGFGISSAAMVRQVLDVADGAVVGSYFVKYIAENITPAKLEFIVRELFEPALAEPALAELTLEG